MLRFHLGEVSEVVQLLGTEGRMVWPGLAVGQHRKMFDRDKVLILQDGKVLQISCTTLQIYPTLLNWNGGQHLVEGCIFSSFYLINM